MWKKIAGMLGAGAMVALVTVSAAGARGSVTQNGRTAAPCSTLDPAQFVSVIDNPYYPLPVGRTLVYKGIRDGQTQVDRVTVTNKTKVIGGVTATVVRDVAKHGSTILEATTDWFAQDVQGNVCYLGEDTKAFGPNGEGGNQR